MTSDLIVKADKSREPMINIGLIGSIREDGGRNLGSIWRPGFQAMAMYRVGRWAMNGPAYRRPVLWLYNVLHVFVRNFYGIELYKDAVIGRRFLIGHQGAIVIHQYCRIGDDCMVRQGATIGAADVFNETNAPELGNNVEI